MQETLLGVLLLLSPALAFTQSSPISSTYQPATITQIRLHQCAGDSKCDEVAYEVSVRVQETTYVVLTAPLSDEPAMQYAVGRELLVRISANTITWNDILGRSHEVPIIQQNLDRR
jgi:hypothetical protein